MTEPDTGQRVLRALAALAAVGVLIAGAWRIGRPSGATPGTAPAGVLCPEPPNGWAMVPEPPIEPRAGHSMVLAGDSVIVWGGYGEGAGNTFGSGRDGARLDLRTGAWSPIADAPFKSYWHEALWTGREMIVWGGRASSLALAESGAYDTARDTWRRIDEPGWVPEQGTAVWTGSEMLVWGWTWMDPPAVRQSGAAYDPRADRWRALPPTPLADRTNHTAVWTGSEMIVWGGAHRAFLADGAAYDPDADRWRTISPGPIAPRSSHEAVWTGSEMLVWGGIAEGNLAADGAAYDPKTDRWRRIARAPLRARQQHETVWTGREMIVWGGNASGPGAQGDGAAYDPVSDTWRTIQPSPLSARANHAMVWTGHETLVYGGTWGADRGVLPGIAAHC